MITKVNALIITGFGLNCEKETATAFEQAGAEVTQIHLNRLIETPEVLENSHILAFIGGFSFGDHLGAGTVFTSRVRHHLGSQLQKFVDDGKLVIGICNGFQTMARLGLVPAVNSEYSTVQAALAHNNHHTFRDDWVTLKGNENSPCIFTKGIKEIEVPIRHGEGKFVMADEKLFQKLKDNNQIVFQYQNSNGEVATEFPENPNGSRDAIAGVCSPNGRIFGLMPHPEAYLSPYNHPHWTRQKQNGTLPEKGAGQKIFDNAVEFVKENF
ncbi:MAG: phosphoribosylformylglycinamidine synthase I [Lentisphaeria bacterium]|nr:phosphoribosylformylglycinamidine synthase I [Lentisphaeria bacterium]